MLDKAGCRNTEALNIDFLTTNPEDIQFAEVTHMYAVLYHIPYLDCDTDMKASFSLLDPSCSGSGIVNRLDYLLEPGMSTSSLSSNQIKLKSVRSIRGSK